MEELYDKLLLVLQSHDKENAVKMCIEALKDGTIDIIGLYENILAPALNNIMYEFEDEDTLIWQEHLRSEIIITIIENSYLFVIEERDKRQLKRKENVLVLCPKFEDHNIGARMATDIFTIAGFETIFLGSNTPCNTIIESIRAKNINIVSIGVTNFYNIIETKSIIRMIREKLGSNIRFILGGNAFKGLKDINKEMGAEIYLEKLEDILSLGKEVDIE